MNQSVLDFISFRTISANYEQFFAMTYRNNTFLPWPRRQGIFLQNFEPKTKVLGVSARGRKNQK
jgi:hypothetical protein